MEMLLQRQPSKDGATIGELFVDGYHECYTCEDEVRLKRMPDGTVTGTKVYGKTAIPAGRYRVVVTWSERFQRLLPILLDVPLFTGVRMHIGNTQFDTDGCLLTGLLKGKNEVGQSKMAFEPLCAKIVEATKAGVCWITIKDAEEAEVGVSATMAQEPARRTAEALPPSSGPLS